MMVRISWLNCTSIDAIWWPSSKILSQACCCLFILPPPPPSDSRRDDHIVFIDFNNCSSQVGSSVRLCTALCCRVIKFHTALIPGGGGDAVLFAWGKYYRFLLHEVKYLSPLEPLSISGLFSYRTSQKWIAYQRGRETRSPDDGSFNMQFENLL